MARIFINVFTIATTAALFVLPISGKAVAETPYQMTTYEKTPTQPAVCQRFFQLCGGYGVYSCCHEFECSFVDFVGVGLCLPPLFTQLLNKKDDQQQPASLGKAPNYNSPTYGSLPYIPPYGSKYEPTYQPHLEPPPTESTECQTIHQACIPYGVYPCCKELDCIRPLELGGLGVCAPKLPILNTVPTVAKLFKQATFSRPGKKCQGELEICNIYGSYTCCPKKRLRCKVINIVAGTGFCVKPLPV